MTNNNKTKIYFKKFVNSQKILYLILIFIGNQHVNEVLKTLTMTKNTYSLHIVFYIYIVQYSLTLIRRYKSKAYRFLNLNWPEQSWTMTQNVWAETFFRTMEDLKDLVPNKDSSNCAIRTNKAVTSKTDNNKYQIDCSVSSE